MKRIRRRTSGIGLKLKVSVDTGIEMLYVNGKTAGEVSYSL